MYLGFQGQIGLLEQMLIWSITNKITLFLWGRVQEAGEGLRSMEVMFHVVFVVAVIAVLFVCLFVGHTWHCSKLSHGSPFKN